MKRSHFKMKKKIKVATELYFAYKGVGSMLLLLSSKEKFLTQKLHRDFDKKILEQGSVSVKDSKILVLNGWQHFSLRISMGPRLHTSKIDGQICANSAQKACSSFLTVFRFLTVSTSIGADLAKDTSEKIRQKLTSGPLVPFFCFFVNDSHPALPYCI